MMMMFLLALVLKVHLFRTIPLERAFLFPMRSSHFLAKSLGGKGEGGCAFGLAEKIFPTFEDANLILVRLSQIDAQREFRWFLSRFVSNLGLSR